MSEATPRTRVTLCGSLGLEIDGRDVASALPGGQAGLLARFLLVSPERAAERDELVELLWPRKAPRDPGAALRPLLSRLRRALAPATLEGRERLRPVLPEPVWSDVEAAARAVADCRRRDGNTRSCCSRRSRSWRGAALALRTAPGSAAAERASRELIARAPFRERGHRLPMEALAAGGNVAEALRVYERLRVLLRDELGVAPAAELQALHLRLLSGEGAGPEPVPAPAVPAAPGGPRPLPPPLALASALPFVGRLTELETLRRHMEADGRAVLVGGEAGAGKSRLVREFAAEAAGGGALVLHGACHAMSARRTARSWRRSTISSGSSTRRSCVPGSGRRRASSGGCCRACSRCSADPPLPSTPIRALGRGHPQRVEAQLAGGRDRGGRRRRAGAPRPARQLGRGAARPLTGRPPADPMACATARLNPRARSA